MRSHRFSFFSEFLIGAMRSSGPAKYVLDSIFGFALGIPTFLEVMCFRISSSIFKNSFCIFTILALPIGTFLLFLTRFFFGSLFDFLLVDFFGVVFFFLDLVGPLLTLFFVFLRPLLGIKLLR